MNRPGIVGCAAAFCIVLPAGCAQEPQARPTVTTTVTVTSSSGSAPTPAVQFPPEPGPDAKTVALRDFVTPSGNITCTDEFDSLSCVVKERDFETPDEPEGCNVDWVDNEIDFVPPVTTLGECRGDPPPAILHPDAPTLEYGTVDNLKDGVKCLSESRGLTCWAPASGHGFFVSKSVFAIF